MYFMAKLHLLQYNILLVVLHDNDYDNYTIIYKIYSALLEVLHRACAMSRARVSLLGLRVMIAELSFMLLFIAML